ncbi:MAG TPA: hypothetical protein VLW53_07370 [Candidatus Eisenbacteria bacterium]|nr:hypothetical protein [Candidatus Eisenbacteria bacterium]
MEPFGVEGSTPVTAMSTTLVRRGGAAALAVTMAAAGLVLVAAPAQAAQMNWKCKILNSNLDWSGNASADAPSNPKAGQTATATINLPAYRNGPVPVAANKVQTVVTVSINGQSVTVKGATNPTALAPDAPLPIAPIKVQFKPKSGENTIVLTEVDFDYLPGQPDTTCTGDKVSLASFSVAAAAAPAAPAAPAALAAPAAPAQPAAPVQPVAQPNNNAGPNTGALPQTGPEDAGQTLLIALAVLQVGLIAAVRFGRRTAPATTGRRR